MSQLLSSSALEALRLCFVGPMLGRHPGNVMTQAEVLAARLASAGHCTVSVSDALNRYARMSDIVVTLCRQRTKIDIQCLQIYGGPSFVVEDIASLLGHVFGHRIIMVLRGGAIPDFMSRHPVWSCRVLRRADVIVAPSPFLARALTRYGLTTRVIPNVIDIAVYPFRWRATVAPRLFWMRTFHPVYNPQMAVRVLGQLRRLAPEATLIMAGQEKGEEAKVRKLAENMGLAGSISFLGYLDMVAKVREGSRSDIFLNTNRIDNTPVSVIEACAMGMPVVATNVGGISDLLTNGETGLLVPDDDEEAMTAAILRLLGDSKLAGRLSANGRKLAESFSWETIGPQWERLFREVMTVSTPNSSVS